MSKKSRRSDPPPDRPRDPGTPGAPLAHGVATAGLAAPPRFHLWHALRDFAGLGSEATYFWPRWWVLRAVGVVFLFVFAGIISQAHALIAPDGIAQLAEFFASLRQVSGNSLVALLHAPSLFWLGQGSAMISAVAWIGMAASIALVFNLWPRLALFVCWLCFLSFVTTWRAFSPAQLDGLMLEVALLCIPFAPAGIRPGLGLASPPRPLAVFMVRWLLFRVMFESGIVKLTSGDPHWRDFSAMDIMYETAPFPTVFGWWDHQLPRWYHVGEIIFTFLAELAAPIAAVFGGRRGRWFALVVWTLFQIGIQLTNNFGWLNTASIGLGLLLLDDAMLASLAQRWRRSAWTARLSVIAASSTAWTPKTKAWWRVALPVALWAHFYLTLFFFARAAGVQLKSIPEVLAWPANLARDFHSANGYYLYATLEPVRFQVEFVGTNDGGKTWRPYPYKNIPQREDEICGFIAPWFSRFEATLEIEVSNGRKSPVYPPVAGHLLARNPRVMALFRSDPFSDGRPTAIRMRGYRMFFADAATRAKTGKFWRREPAGDYLPMMFLDERGNLSEANLGAGDAAIRAGDIRAAYAIFEQQYQSGFSLAGFRVAEMHARNVGGIGNPARAFAIYSALEKDGEVGAEHYVGVAFEYGIGVPIDYAAAAKQYRKAANHGYVPSLLSLGLLHANDRLVPRDDVAGLAALLEAMARASGDDPTSRYIRDQAPAAAKRLTDRMSAVDIERAKRMAGPR